MNKFSMPKMEHWVSLYGYQPVIMQEDFADAEFVLFVNQTYLKLLEGNVQDNFATQGLNYDPAIKTSFEFYCANQKELRSLLIMGGE